MRFSIATAAALVAGATASYNNTGPVYTTEVVTAYTTYCPAPTQITHGGKTYTITEATTFTITDCPCTVTKPVASTPVPVYTPPVVPHSSGAGAPYPSANGTTPVYTPPVGTGSATPAPPKFTGAANKAFAASGAGLAAVFGVAAYIL
ncbi:hypothetical protein K469DRAFT_722596 [Zopfia rhizophila CBS 207.26]|uniref:Clock-controlled protein 6 n=1 Tax=Zopfia rhizophila CBS 207.26 TaxID=1314779 RepID=A0A6A6EX31_9PEZI|nr:hypothetical protein K469DRAFT_722596 [Zopfia rhizophila CBS 207.26]